MLAVSAVLLCVPHADAGRRDPSVPIVVTPPAGNITVHMETPEPSASPTFRTLGSSERAKKPSVLSKRKFKRKSTRKSQRKPKP